MNTLASPLPTRAAGLMPTLAGQRARAPEGDIPTLNWLGQPVDCGTCPHGAERARLGCEPGYSCMQDVYARRIDRFFRRHPDRAQQQLAHPYFEVRAIAARFVDLFHLNALRSDPDETVRMQVALRLPPSGLLALRDDPHREVRIRVAQRLDQAQLGPLVHDADYQVRTIVAQRLPLALLPLMATDADEQVRRVVAERLPMPTLWRLASDAAPSVRGIVAQRVPLPLLGQLAADAHWAVRWHVADRAALHDQAALLHRLARDPDAEVSRRALERLADHVPPLHEVLRHG